MNNIYLVFWSYFFLSTLYIMLLTLAGRLRKNISLGVIEKKVKIAVLVPAFKEDAIIVGISRKLLTVNYPNNLFDIIIIADSLKKETILELKELPIKTLEVSWNKSTKAKSINKALSLIPEDYEIAVISDADNIMHNDFLLHVNNAFQHGYDIIQGKRMPKNLDTPIAFLDAASEGINNHIFRKGANALGLSSALIGSGMAFRYDLLKRELAEIDAIGGFDKKLQLKLTEKKHKILYLEQAIVFDEKVSSSSAFKNQRRRWLSTQFIYLPESIVKGFKKLLEGNISYFNLSVLSNIFLSRILTLGVIFFFSIIVSLSGDNTMLIMWWSIFLCYLVSLMLALPSGMYNRKLFGAILTLPKVFLNMVISLIQIRGANKDFIHTTHSKITVDQEVYEPK